MGWNENLHALGPPRHMIGHPWDREMMREREKQTDRQPGITAMRCTSEKKSMRPDTSAPFILKPCNKNCHRAEREMDVSVALHYLAIVSVL